MLVLVVPNPFFGLVGPGILSSATVSRAQLLRPFGFVELRFVETGPVPLRVRGKIDVVLWRLLKLGANTVRRIETGKTQGIWTENFICLARRPGSLEPTRVPGDQVPQVP